MIFHIAGAVVMNEEPGMSVGRPLGSSTQQQLITSHQPYEGVSTMVMMSFEEGYMKELVSALNVREVDDVSCCVITPWKGGGGYCLASPVM